MVQNLRIMLILLNRTSILPILVIQNLPMSISLIVNFNTMHFLLRLNFYWNLIFQKLNLKNWQILQILNLRIMLILLNPNFILPIFVMHNSPMFISSILNLNTMHFLLNPNFYWKLIFQKQNLKNWQISKI